MNVKALRKLQRYILAEPRRFNMKDWGTSDPEDETVMDQKPPCGTVACLAGNAVVMGRKYKLGGDWGTSIVSVKTGHVTRRSIPRYARQVLGITPTQEGRLFYISELGHTTSELGHTASGWPEPFARRYVKAMKLGRLKMAAKIAAARIEHFIATKGRE